MQEPWWWFGRFGWVLEHKPKHNLRKSTTISLS